MIEAFSDLLNEKKAKIAELEAALKNQQAGKPPAGITRKIK